MHGRTPNYYKPIGDDKQGFKLTIPAIVKRAEKYRFEYLPNGVLKFIPEKA